MTFAAEEERSSHGQLFVCSWDGSRESVKCHPVYAVGKRGPRRRTRSQRFLFRQRCLLCQEGYDGEHRRSDRRRDARPRRETRHGEGPVLCLYPVCGGSPGWRGGPDGRRSVWHGKEAHCFGSRIKGFQFLADTPLLFTWKPHIRSSIVPEGTGVWVLLPTTRENRVSAVKPRPVIMCLLWRER